MFAKTKRLASFAGWLCLSACNSIVMPTPAEAAHRGNPVGVTPPTSTYLVQSGCSQPANNPTGVHYFAKPAGSGGSDAADGLTLGTAWATGNHTLAAGDWIEFQSGTYPSWNPTQNNSGFVYYKAGAGQTPLFPSISVNGSANKMVFQGLKIQQSGAGFLLLFDIEGAASNIVIYGNDVSSADDGTVTGWAHSAWDQSGGLGLVAFSGIFIGTTAANPCITANNNTLHSLYFGISVAGKVASTYNAQAMIDSNTLRWISGQAIGYAGHNITVSNNTITDPVDPGNASIHTDNIIGGIGYCPDEGCVYDNDKILGNWIVENWTNPSPWPTSPTSITGSPESLVSYDEAWTNKIIANNVVIGGPPDIIEDVSCSSGCLYENNVAINYPVGTIHGYMNINDVLASKSTTPTAGAVIRNNAVSNLSISCNGSSNCQSTYNVDHNLIDTQLSWWPGGVNQNTTTNGTYGTGNTITATALTAWFTTYVPATPAYDMHPLVGTSPLLANGTLPAYACPDGSARHSNPDQGAYC